MKGGIVFDGDDQIDQERKLSSNTSQIDEMTGSLSRDDSDMKLMHSVLEGDKDVIDDGKLISESVSKGLGSFTPDLIFEKLVRDFKDAKKILGDSIIRELSGYDPAFVEKNLPLPEFKKMLKENINKQVEKLKEEGLITKDGHITKEGYYLSSVILFMEELDHLRLSGLGERLDRKRDVGGERQDYRSFRNDRFHDIAIKQTIKTAIRRGHKQIAIEDFRAYDRKKKGKIIVIYAMDTSGSMKGEKIHTAKKAGIALAYRAISERNRIGLILFDSEIRTAISPSRDFGAILEALTRARAGLETRISIAIEKAIELFPRSSCTRHLVLLTDALPTKGSDPSTETLRLVSIARDSKITVSLIGINLEGKGLDLAKRIVEVGAGRLYITKDLKELDKIILKDYDGM